MQKAIPALLIGFACFLTTCEKEEIILPSAQISHSSNNYESGDTIYFYSNAESAEEYLWDFGDGFTSNEENPFHIYDIPWLYNVSLKVTNTNGSNEYGESITVRDPTILAFQVTYPGEIYPLVKIELYDSEEDWLNEEPALMRDYTDLDGLVEFYHVESKIYFVYATGNKVIGPDLYVIYGGGTLPEPVELNTRTEYNLDLVYD